MCRQVKHNTSNSQLCRLKANLFFLLSLTDSMAYGPIVSELVEQVLAIHRRTEVGSNLHKEASKKAPYFIM
jgi:hypothetical protein